MLKRHKMTPPVRICSCAWCRCRVADAWIYCRNHIEYLWFPLVSWFLLFFGFKTGMPGAAKKQEEHHERDRRVNSDTISRFQQCDLHACHFQPFSKSFVQVNLESSIASASKIVGSLVQRLQQNGHFVEQIRRTVVWGEDVQQELSNMHIRPPGDWDILALMQQNHIKAMNQSETPEILWNVFTDSKVDSETWSNAVKAFHTSIYSS